MTRDPHPSGDHREAAVTIRPMHRDDVPTIVAIEQQSFSDPWSALTFRSALTRPHTRASAAVDPDGRPCGYCVLLHVLDEGEIANIAVDPARRGRGIAGRLLDDALAAAGQLELSRVFLEVR
ncbi:MAG: GNAT family N-acetyltransferase, partial [Gemmatimonadaceae bacterium]